MAQHYQALTLAGQSSVYSALLLLDASTVVLYTRRSVQIMQPVYSRNMANGLHENLVSSRNFRHGNDCHRGFPRLVSGETEASVLGPSPRTQA